MEHLEKTLKEFDEKFTTFFAYPVIVRGELKEKYRLLNTYNANDVKDYLITSHINYLKGEIERLENHTIGYAFFRNYELLELQSQLSKAEQLLGNE
jgi:hypothetical protein